ARDGGADRTAPGVVDRVDREHARRFSESVTLEGVEARASEEVAETLAERAATGGHAIALAAEGAVQLAVHQRREDLRLEGGAGGRRACPLRGLGVSERGLGRVLERL